jgi:hypothetical protein
MRGVASRNESLSRIMVYRDAIYHGNNELYHKTIVGFMNVRSSNELCYARAPIKSVNYTGTHLLQHSAQSTKRPNYVLATTFCTRGGNTST